MTGLALTRSSIAAVAFAALVGCASGTPPTRGPGTTSAASSAAVVTPAGPPSTADGLCGVFTADLALAALGVPVAQPTGGDVVPRPNGIYCHYAAADDANTNVEAQLKDMTRTEFETLAENLDTTTPLPGVGEVAFSRSSSNLGIPGAAVAAWSGGRGVTVSINSEGNQSAMLAAAQAIATAVLLANP